jgi:hypothetical protein
MNDAKQITCLELPSGDQFFIPFSAAQTTADLLA